MIDFRTGALTWWLTGLSGAGKTTLAQALVKRLSQSGIRVCVLDGDSLRQGLCKDLGFSLEDRAENMRRVAEVAKLLNATGVHVVTALISPTHAGRATACEIIGSERFIEAYIATPLAVCQQRDTKGLYARAQFDTKLELTGVRSPYEAPVSPGVVIDTSATSVAAAVEMLINAGVDRTRSEPGILGSAYSLLSSNDHTLNERRASGF